MRLATIVFVIGLALGAVFVPAAGPPGLGSSPGLEPPPIAVCPLIEVGDRSTGVAVVSSDQGDGRMLTFSSGDQLGQTEFSVGAVGLATLDAREAGAIAEGGGLVELPGSSSAAAASISGGTSVAADGCGSEPAAQTLITGGTTAGGSGFEVLLINPYSAEAVADLTVFSESGVESDARFEGIIVPALSTRTVDMGVIVPGRTSLSVVTETRRGSLIGYALLRSGEREALWRSVEPAQDWWVPVPPGETPKSLVIASPLAVDLEYQIDVYGLEGFQEGFATGILASRSQFRLDLSQITSEVMAVRVTSSAPVVTTLAMESETVLAMTTGATVDASSWLLPGAGAPPGSTSQIVILNSGVETVQVDVTALSDPSISDSFTLDAEEVDKWRMIEADGYRLDASGPVVILWVEQSETDASLSIGAPLPDG